MQGLPGSLADFGPAALAAVVVAGYLVVGEPVVGAVLHRRFEGRLRSDPAIGMLVNNAGMAATGTLAEVDPDVDAFTAAVVLVRVHSRGSVRLRSADPTWAPAIDAGYLCDELDLDRIRQREPACGVSSWPFRPSWPSPACSAKWIAMPRPAASCTCVA